MASSSSSFEPQNEQQILARFQQLRNEFNTYANKIAELELDQTDHRLVVGTLQKLEPERRCFRLVGGVLVERTVAEVLPAVQKNLEGIDEVIEQLTKSLREKEAELNAFQTKYKIKVRGERDSNEDERSDSDKQSKSQGVLA